MKLLPLLLAPLCAVFFTGCESSRAYIEHDFDPKHDLANAERFALLPMVNDGVSQEIRIILGEGEVPLVGVKSVLEGKGYSQVEEADAQLFVGIRAEFHPPKLPEVDSMADRTWQGRSGVERDVMGTFVVGGGKANPDWDPDLDLPWNEREPNPHTQQVGEAGGLRLNVSKPYYVLWVDIYDAQSDFLVWQGFAYSQIAASFSSDEQRLAAVQALLKEFPN